MKQLSCFFLFLFVLLAGLVTFVIFDEKASQFFDDTFSNFKESEIKWEYATVSKLEQTTESIAFTNKILSNSITLVTPDFSLWGEYDFGISFLKFKVLENRHEIYTGKEKIEKNLREEGGGHPILEFLKIVAEEAKMSFDIPESFGLELKILHFMGINGWEFVRTNVDKPYDSHKETTYIFRRKTN